MALPVNKLESAHSYMDILNLYPLKRIDSENENQYCLEVYQIVLNYFENHPDLTFLEDYLDTLSILIDNYEQKAYEIRKPTGVETLIFLMEQHNLKQKDLKDIFKTQSILSEILNGKRMLTLEHIKKLSEKFNTTPAVFV